MKKSNSYPTRRTRQPSPEPEARTDPQPGTITSIQSQVHDPDRVSIFIDGQFSLGVARDVADEFGLRKDDVLDEAALAELVAREGLHKATTAALNFLAYRPRSEGEIRQRLRKGGFPEPAIDYTIEKLRDWHYVDDADFARRWIENRSTHRPRGARLLTQELKAKGIDSQVMAEAIEEAELDEPADALTIARQRARQLADLDQDVRERRLSGFLARRGYGFDIIRATLNELRGEAEDLAELDPEDGDA
jgi:regulatory protein